MAGPRRPASENYQPVCCSVTQSISYSSEAGILDDDHAPIFSLSKSSMDVVTATGPPHKRDPAWTRMDLKRSSSTNTHCEQHAATLQQLQPHIWQHLSAAGSHQLSPTTQSVDLHSPPALSERWINNMQRWSGCSSSSSAHSRSSTPDTVVYRGRSERPNSLTQDAVCPPAVPDSPMSKLTSTPTTPSPFISPLHTPTLPPVDLWRGDMNGPNPHQHHRLEAAPTSSPLQTRTLSPFGSNSPEELGSGFALTEDHGFLENNLLMFQFPSPISGSAPEAGVSSDPEMEQLPTARGAGFPTPRCGEGARSPGQVSPVQVSPGQISPVQVSPVQVSPGQINPGQINPGQINPVQISPGQMSSFQTPESVSRSKLTSTPVGYLELPGQSDQSFPMGRGRRSPLVSSLSDSRLGSCCRCKKSEAFREEATMTLRLDLVDAAVQTSPAGSWWELRRNTSNLGSHSILGSPPGSRLNLKSSVGSNSNLVSPSSSMFPVSSGEEEEEEGRRGEERRGRDPAWDASPLELEGRRSCLKSQQEEKDEMGRRSSMKQVQWDEDGMTWDVHGASVDPEVLSTAIQKHLELQNSPRPLRRSAKKKKAPKPPVISNVVRAMVPEINPPAIVTTSTRMAEGESEETLEAGEETEQGGGGNKEETQETPRRRSRADGDKEEEEDEVYGDEGNPPTSGNSRKKSVIRSLRRPGWCGGSRKADD